SFDYLEIAVNQGNAAKSLGMSVGDSLTIYFA
ncbi:MAG: hydroxide adenosyltransferase, partial [Thermoprotei archaeon]